MERAPGRPSPRKLRDASSTTAAPKALVEMTRNGATQCGRDVAKHDPGAAGADDPGRSDELGTRHGQRLASHHTGSPGGLHKRDGQDDVRGRCAQHGHDAKRQHQRGEGQQGVGRLLEDCVGESAVVAAHNAGKGARGGTQHDGEDADAQRYACAECDAAPDVATQVVGAQPVRCTRRVEDAFGVLRDRVVGREHGGEDGHRHEQQHDGAAGHPKRPRPDESYEPSTEAEFGNGVHGGC